MNVNTRNARISICKANQHQLMYLLWHMVFRFHFLISSFDAIIHHFAYRFILVYRPPYHGTNLADTHHRWQINFSRETFGTHYIDPSITNFVLGISWVSCWGLQSVISLSKSCHFHIRDIRRIRHLLPLSAATATALANSHRRSQHEARGGNCLLLNFQIDNDFASCFACSNKKNDLNFNQLPQASFRSPKMYY